MTTDQRDEKIQDLAEIVRRLRDENARLLSESARKDRVLAEQAVALSAARENAEAAQDYLLGFAAIVEKEIKTRNYEDAFTNIMWAVTTVREGDSLEDAP